LSRPKLIKYLKSKNPNLNKSELEAVVDVFCESLSNALLENKNIELRDFGTFFVKRIKEKYSARNPKTGELIYVPAKNKVRFKSSKRLKKFLNE
tara:strand:- start:138 stop:419 length:282 start_codon:yes stop_codon:yes gene_type:complete